MDKKKTIVKKAWPLPNANVLLSKWEEFRIQNQLKKSVQRELVVETFFSAIQGHISIEGLWSIVKSKNPAIGYVTVYRTIKLLEDANLAISRQFVDGQTRYEVSGPLAPHHDHLICLTCGHIMEFECDKIELLQREVVKQLGDFTLVDHRMDLYVNCAKGHIKPCHPQL